MLSMAGEGRRGGGGEAGLELSAVISAKRSKCWEFLARGSALPAPPKGPRPE